MAHIIQFSSSSKEVHQRFASIPKKQILNIQINPWFFSAFIDAEVRWIVFIIRNKKLKHGLMVLVFLQKQFFLIKKNGLFTAN